MDKLVVSNSPVLQEACLDEIFQSRLQSQYLTQGQEFHAKDHTPGGEDGHMYLSPGLTRLRSAAIITVTIALCLCFTASGNSLEVPEVLYIEAYRRNLYWPQTLIEIV